MDCSPLIDGTIKVLVKRGGSAYYQSFNFANARVVGAGEGGEMFCGLGVSLAGRMLSRWWAWAC